ncbi:unnamed protein product, partial [Discosporangium mesarthrocarpum]
TCNAALKTVLRRERPRRLLEAIREGLLEQCFEIKNKREVGTEHHPPGKNVGTGKKSLCQKCLPPKGPAGGGRAFLEHPPTTAVLCANRLRSAGELEEALVHELVHAFDWCVARRDLLDCQGLAWSEVRAAREAECGAASRSFPCSFFRKRCTRAAAERSTQVRVRVVVGVPKVTAMVVQYM